MQALIFAVPEQTQDELSVGLVQPLTSPYNLFLNLDQLITSDQVDFFVYSIGSQRKILWGRYIKSTDIFQIDSGCEYKPRQLYEITLNWTRSGYTYIGNAVLNRQDKLIQEYLGEDTGMTYEEYTQLKYLAAYMQQEITETEYESVYGPLPDIPEEPEDYYDYLADIQEQIQTFEEDFNRFDLNALIMQRLTRPLRELVERITEKFRNAVAVGDFTNLPHCPTYEECYLNPDTACHLYFFTEPDFT